MAEEERRAKRGKLIVFFGAAPGVGKTYAMLEAARTERDQKRDVVIGVVETHGRYDTGALVLGLELLPRREDRRTRASPWRSSISTRPWRASPASS